MIKDLEGQLVCLVRLSKIYKRPPVKGYLFHFKETNSYGIISGGGFTQPINEDTIIAIHNNHIIID